MPLILIIIGIVIAVIAPVIGTHFPTWPLFIISLLLFGTSLKLSIRLKNKKHSRKLLILISGLLTVMTALYVLLLVIFVIVILFTDGKGLQIH